MPPTFHPKMGASIQFQAKMPKYKNRTISKIVNPIKPKLEDTAATTLAPSTAVMIFFSWLTCPYRRRRDRQTDRLSEMDNGATTS